MTKQKTIIGVMGPGNGAAEQDKHNAAELGRQIAQNNWVLLTGGRKAGVMDAASRGAREAGGLVIGILPDADKRQMSDYVDIPIVTGLGFARNSMNVLTSDVVVACGIGPGTTSEIAYAIRAEKPLILLTDDKEAVAYFKKLSQGKIHITHDYKEAVRQVKKLLKK